MTAPISPDLPIRPAFWNVPLWGEIGVYVLAAVSVGLFVWGVVRGLRATRRGAEGDPSLETRPKDPKALARTLRSIVFADRIRETAFGNVHAALVIGFFLLFLGTALATLDWDIGHYVFGEQFLRGNFYLAYKLFLDLAGLTVLAALLIGIVRRYRSATLPRTDRFLWAYASLAFVVLSGFGVEALRLAAEKPLWIDFSPVGAAIARTFLFDSTRSSLESAHIVLWVVHGLASLAFIAAIPLTFYGHMYRTPLSILNRKPLPQGRLPKIEAIEEQETFGLSRIAQLSEAERFQLEGCVECGRCDDFCPAVRAGTPLAPRTIVLKLRERAERLARGLEDDGRALVGDVVTHEELFSCTTCGACARACPAEIATPDLIVKMRRHLAIESGEFPEGAATALENTASVGNPWGLDPYERLDWGKDLDLPVAQEGVRYDILYWVGCAASYDRRARRIARAVVRILKAAGVNFAVLSEERCHAEFARRLGEEYLFQTAAQENAETFARYDFGRVLTACPHCFNTLRNEYPGLEGMPELDVVDHATFIEELVRSGKLSGLTADTLPTVYHDPCYLARMNGIEEAPRSLLGRSTALRLPEASGEATFCCGAGGGQIWCETKAPRPVNVIRLHALRDTGAERIAVACPHCLTMLESAKATENLDGLAVRDIAEIVAERLDAPEAD